MAQCPNCQAEIPDDAFGLTNCQNCGAQVMAGLDGVELAAAPVEAVMPETAPAENAALDELTKSILTDLQEGEGALVNSRAGADLAELADYGNSPVSQAREGVLRFHLYISGIDTADVRKMVREVLEEPRFLLDVDLILNSIRDGRVKIADVTAVKAAVLIQKLRPLPVDITWEQYAIHST